MHCLHARRDCGWAGLSFCPGSGSGGASFGAADSMDAVQTAVARHFARDVLLYQGARCVRTLHTVQAPTALHYLPQLPNSNTNLLALAEEHQVRVRHAAGPGRAPVRVHVRACVFVSVCARAACCYTHEHSERGVGARHAMPAWVVRVRPGRACGQSTQSRAMCGSAHPVAPPRCMPRPAPPIPDPCPVLTWPPQVSLWDVRAGEAGGCVERIPMALGCPLYALDWCGAEGGLLGTAGADRAVTLLEPRK